MLQCSTTVQGQTYPVLLPSFSFRNQRKKREERKHALPGLHPHALLPISSSIPIKILYVPRVYNAYNMRVHASALWAKLYGPFFIRESTTTVPSLGFPACTRFKCDIRLLHCRRFPFGEGTNCQSMPSSMQTRYNSIFPWQCGPIIPIIPILRPKRIDPFRKFPKDSIVLS